MLRIHGSARSRALRTLWMVGELDLNYEHNDVLPRSPGTRTPEFLALNPNGRVPVIEDSGVVVWESHAILRYVAARYGRVQFWSDDPAERSQAERWMDWSQTALQPDFQHSELRWWAESDLMASDRVHDNTKAYFR